MPIRQARYRDLPSIYSTLASAFRNDPFQSALFPYISEHPEDYKRAWRHQILESYWDYTKMFFVSYDVDEESGKEVIKSVSVWKRHGDGWESLWGIRGRWDPRLLIRRILVTIHSLHRKLFPNQASIRPTPSNPKPLTNWTWLEAVAPYAAKYFTPPSLAAVATGQMHATIPGNDSQPPAPRPSFWELAMLGTHSASHGQGHGRKLVEAGLARAQADHLPAVVVAADKKETFYQRCGFWNLVGWATEGDDNPLRVFGVGGGAILWNEGPVAAKEGVAGERQEEKKEEEGDYVAGESASASAIASMSASRSSTVSSFEVVSGVLDGKESGHGS